MWRGWTTKWYFLHCSSTPQYTRVHYSALYSAVARDQLYICTSICLQLLTSHILIVQHWRQSSLISQWWWLSEWWWWWWWRWWWWWYSSIDQYEIYSDGYEMMHRWRCICSMIKKALVAVFLIFWLRINILIEDIQYRWMFSLTINIDQYSRWDNSGLSIF